MKQGETVFCCKNNPLALKWMDKREVYILSGLQKATNVISKKTNYKGQKVTKPEKDYTSEINKIARMSVKPIQKDAQHV